MIVQRLFNNSRNIRRMPLLYCCYVIRFSDRATSLIIT